MTGAYLRAKRNGAWVNVEVEHLTEEELISKFVTRPPEELVRWMSMLCAKLRQIEPVLNGLVEDGILTLHDPRSTVNDNSENESEP